MVLFIVFNWYWLWLLTQKLRFQSCITLYASQRIRVYIKQESPQILTTQKKKHNFTFKLNGDEISSVYERQRNKSRETKFQFPLLLFFVREQRKTLTINCKTIIIIVRKTEENQETRNIESLWDPSFAQKVRHKAWLKRRKRSFVLRRFMESVREYVGM